MEVTNSVVINGNEVKDIGGFSGFKVFEIKGQDDERPTYYISQDNKIVGQIDIECGMGQGIGYVANIMFSTPF